MTHPDPETLLDLALETASEADAAAAREHLNACSECADAYERLEDEQRALKEGLSPAAAPGHLAPRIRTAMRREPMPLRKRARLFVAAAAALVLAAGLYASQAPNAAQRKQVMLDQVKQSELMALGLEGGH
jgi:anti-sigma factor RsiW